MKENIGRKFSGLTDDPARRKIEHGNPTDFAIERIFSSENEARAWEQAIQRAGHIGGVGEIGEVGWRAGYTYTITSSTVE